MLEHDDEVRPSELTATDLQDLLGELGANLNVDQLRALLELVQSCDDLDEAQAALEQVARAA